MNVYIRDESTGVRKTRQTSSSDLSLTGMNVHLRGSFYRNPHGGVATAILAKN